MAVTMSRLSLEYLFFPVTTSNDLTGATAEVAFMPDAVTLPGALDWVAATIIDPAGSPKLRVLVGPGGDKDLTPGDSNPVDYQVWAKITDNPEIPVRKPGTVTVE